MKHKYPYSFKSNWQEKQIVINHNNEKSQIAKQGEWLLSWAGPSKTIMKLEKFAIQFASLGRFNDATKWFT